MLTEPASARDHRPAVWSHSSGCDVRLGLEHLHAVGERERFTCQVEGEGQGLVAVPGPGSDEEVGVVRLFGLDHRVDQPLRRRNPITRRYACSTSGCECVNSHRSFGISGRTASSPLGRCSLIACRPNSSP